MGIERDYWSTINLTARVTNLRGGSTVRKIISSWEGLPFSKEPKEKILLNKLLVGMH